MSGLLVTLRESWANHLLGYDTLDAVAGWTMTPRAFFAAEPAIPVFTEKLNTIEQAVTNSLLKTGISVIVATVIARKCEPQQPGVLYYRDITAVARVIANPKTNMTGLEGSDIAEAIVWFTKKWNPPGGCTAKHEEIVIGTHGYGSPASRQQAVCWDVLYSLEGKAQTPPSR